MATILRLVHDQRVPLSSNWHLQTNSVDSGRREVLLSVVDTDAATLPIDRHYFIDHVIDSSLTEGKSNLCFDEAVASYSAGAHCHIAFCASASRWEMDDSTVDPLFQTIEADLVEASRKLVETSPEELYVDILLDDTQGHLTGDFPKSQSANIEGPQRVTSLTTLASLLSIVVKRRSQLRGSRAVSLIVFSNSPESLLQLENDPIGEGRSCIVFVLPSAYPLIPTSGGVQSYSPTQSYVSLSCDMFSRAYFSHRNDEECSLYETLIDRSVAWCALVKRLSPRRAELSAVVYTADGSITGNASRCSVELMDLFFTTSEMEGRLAVAASNTNLSPAAVAHIEAQSQLLEAAAQRIAKLETLLKLKSLPDASLAKMLMDSALETEVLRKRCMLLENRLRSVKSSKNFDSSNPTVISTVAVQPPPQVCLEILQCGEWEDSTSSPSSPPTDTESTDSDSDTSTTTSSSESSTDTSASDRMSSCNDVLSSLRLGDIEALLPRGSFPRTFPWRDDATRHQQLQRLLTTLQSKQDQDSDVVLDWASIPSILRTFLHSFVRTQEQCLLLAAHFCPHHLMAPNVQVDARGSDFEDLVLFASRFPWVNTPELLLRALLPDALQRAPFQNDSLPRVVDLKLSGRKSLHPGSVLDASIQVTNNVDLTPGETCRWPARLRWYRVPAGQEADPSEFLIVKEVVDGDCQYVVTQNDVGQVLWFEVLPRDRVSGMCGAAASVRSSCAVASGTPQVSNVRIVQCSNPEVPCQWVCVGDYVRVEYTLDNVGLEGATHIRWFAHGSGGSTWIAEGRAPSCILQVPCSASFSYLCAEIVPVRAKDNLRGTSQTTLSIFVVPRLEASAWLDELMCRVATLKPLTPKEHITSEGYEWRSAPSSNPNVEASSLSGVFMQDDPLDGHGITQQLLMVATMTSCSSQRSSAIFQSPQSNNDEGTCLKTSIGSPCWKDETSLASASAIVTSWLKKCMPDEPTVAFLRVERHGIEFSCNSAHSVRILWCNVVWIRELVVAVSKQPSSVVNESKRTPDYYPIIIKYYTVKAQGLTNAVSCIFCGRDAFERCLMALRCFLQLSQLNRTLSPMMIEECRTWGASWLQSPNCKSTIPSKAVGTVAHRHFNFLQEEL